MNGPLSAFLFVLSVELLAINIRNDKGISGIKIEEREIKISQLADDTTCFLSNLESVNQIIKIFDEFYVCAGLRVNLEKSKAYYIGSLKGTNSYCYGLDWTDQPIQSLGIVFATNDNDHYILNYKKRIKSLNSLLQMWSQRRLSLKGKVTVINNLALPSLLYVVSVTHVPDRVVKEVNNILDNFMWNGGRPKIAKNVMIRKIEDGGLKLIDLESKIKAIRLSWVQKLLNNSDASWKSPPRYFYGEKNLTQFFQCKRAPSISDNMPLFYREIHKCWCEINNVEPVTNKLIRNEILWNNIFITGNKRPLYWRDWVGRGIIYINDILNEQGSFMSHTDITAMYNINCNFLSILQIRQSIPYKWRQMLCVSNDNENVKIERE